jgi:hypothetical protein
MKTRIKVVKRREYTEYWPQHRWFGFWLPIFTHELGVDIPFSSFSLERVMHRIDEFRVSQGKETVSYMRYPE